MPEYLHGQISIGGDFLSFIDEKGNIYSWPIIDGELQDFDFDKFQEASGIKFLEIEEIGQESSEISNDDIAAALTDINSRLENIESGKYRIWKQ
jgi:alpha-tubulin suppressor-like RCC1 family protein